ncbi:hypothetical protein BMW22_38845 (plasmid) [Rhizobium leguminosarum]|uniref:Uncharacterized protein n=1 Tax=Rhizobium leguminosarum TaxID=384 RepID=A0A1L3ZP16_RHILE|nr:hypothetical protein BMW22_38845 [Rhizobium leguminosarum]
MTGAAIGTFVLIFRLHTIRENHRSGYARIEIAMATIVIVLVFANSLQNLGMNIKVGRWIPLIGSAASAVYFGVRAWDNLY